MQGFRIADTIRLSDKLLWIGIGVCIFYWVGESALHVLAFREGNLASQILPQNFHEIWKRILVIGLIISFSFYAQLRVNERRENEKMLEESEKKYRTLFEDALNPVFLFDEKGRYIDCNGAALEFLEFSRENLEGKMIWDFCEHHQTLGEVFSNGSAHRNIETDFSPSGKHKTLLLNLVPFSSSDQKTIFVIGQDITERKAMERNIILAHTELNQIFQTASVGMRLIDMDFNVLKMNETFAVLSGANTQDVVGRKCYEGFAGAMCQKPSCPLTRILGGEKEIECEIDKQRLDGSVAHCLLAARPFVGPDGEFVGIVESFKDISELKRFQEELRSERDKLHRILFERFEGVGIVNADFTIEYQNEALKNEMGDCLGKKCYRVFREEQEPCQACMMQ